MKFIAKLTFLCGILFSTIYTYAIEAPINIVANNITENNIELAWDSVENALGYHIYYSTSTPVDKLTAEKQEYIQETTFNISELSPWSQYNFIITTFDDVWDVSEFSTETSFTTLGTSTSDNAESDVEFNSAWEFKIGSIEVLAQNQVSLSFTSKLENLEDSERVFKVVEKNDELMEYTVNKSDIDLNAVNKVIITFDENLPVDTEFKLTVISILDAQGRNIESWIESFENFIIEEEMLNLVYQEESDSIVIINPDTGKPVNQETTQEGNQTNTTWEYKDLLEIPQIENSWSTTNNDNWNNSVDNKEENSWENSNNDKNTWTKDVGSTNNSQSTIEADWNIEDKVGWKNMSSEDVALDLLSAGQEAEVLPTTWPEHIFMLILALVFGAMSFVFKFKKS